MKAVVESAEDFPIVGIGGSAGGFEAMEALLRALPTDTGMAFILIQHLDPHATSRSCELLRRDTCMPIESITDGQTVQSNHVYVLPPGVYVDIAHRRLNLTKTVGAEHVRMPIDRFFTSLAMEEKYLAIGVVLSGTNTDGTAGLRVIHEEGGITFAQSEASSKYFGMPGSAIDAGCVDFILPPDQIGTRLGQIAQNPAVRMASPRAVKPGETESAAPPKAIYSVLTRLRQHSGVDFTLYKRSTIQRRILRRMVLSRLNKLDDYARLLEVSERERRRFGQDLHDETCQSLTGLAVQLAVFIHRLQKKGIQVEPEFQDLAVELNDLVNNTRRIAHGLHPVSLGDGLVSALHELAAGVADKVPCKVRAKLVSLLSPEVALGLYRIAQEALTNTVKHAHASRAVIRLRQNGAGLVLSVEDDGVGLPKNGLLRPGGMGLDILGYRARSIGGQLVIENLPKRGVRVTCHLPCNALETAA